MAIQIPCIIRIYHYINFLNSGYNYKLIRTIVIVCVYKTCSVILFYFVCVQMGTHCSKQYHILNHC